MATLLLNPILGLCNRWRALLSGLAMAKAGLCELQFVWEPLAPCNVAFDKLWEAAIGVQLPYPLWNELTSPMVDPRTTDFTKLPADAVVRCSAFNTFPAAGAAPLHEAAQLLKPSFEVRQVMQDFQSRRYEASRWIAVCVRNQAHGAGQAHYKSRKAASPVWFTSRVMELAKQDPYVHFLAIADTPEVEYVLRRASPRVVCLKDRVYDPHSPQMVIQCVAWVLLAAQMSGVVGSYWSSMTDMPSLLTPNLRTETPRP